MSTEMTAPLEGMLVLNYEQHDERGETSSTVPFRWCPLKGLRDEVESRRFKNPHLLLIVQACRTVMIDGEDVPFDWEDTLRVLVPLTDEMAYLSFSRPGANRVCAGGIIDMPRGKAAAELLKYIHAKDEKGYEHSRLLTEDGALSDTMFHSRDLWNRVYNYLALATCKDVIVPKEAFAPPPPRWQRHVVGRFFRTKPFDQCHFRRRLWFVSLPASFLMVTFGTLVRLITAVAAVVVGLRRPGWQHLKMPLYGELFGIFADSEQATIYTHKARQPDTTYNEERAIYIFGFLLNPLLYLAVSAAVFLFYRKLGWWLTLGLVSGCLIGLVIAVVVVIMLAVLLTGQAADRIDAWGDSREQRQEARRREMLSELEAMACPGVPPKATLDALPEDKRTIRLKFYEFKRGVCKPFAR